MGKEKLEHRVILEKPLPDADGLDTAKSRTADASHMVYIAPALRTHCYR